MKSMKSIFPVILALLLMLPGLASSKYRSDNSDLIERDTMEFLFNPRGLSLQVGYSRVMLAPALIFSNVQTNRSKDDNYQLTWDNNVVNSVTKSLFNNGYDDPLYMNIPAVEVGMALGSSWIEILVSPWWDVRKECFFLQGTSGVWFGIDDGESPIIAKGHIYFYGSALSFSKTSSFQAAIATSGIVPPISNDNGNMSDITRSPFLNYGLGMINVGTGLKGELGIQIQRMFVLTLSVFGEAGVLLPAAITVDWGMQLHAEAGLPFLRVFMDVRPNKWLFDVSYYTFGVNLLF